MNNWTKLNLVKLRLAYMSALTKLVLDIEVELSGVGKNKLSPSSLEFFSKDYKDAMKARVKYEQAIMMSGMLQNE